jgi:eukaryotic-like serine/threonine-protein kinase
VAAHDDQRPFLEVPPVAGAAQALSAAIDETEPVSAQLQPGTRIGQYEVLEPIGSGGMGEVYRAHDTKLGRFVALKIVLDSKIGGTADRVLREARAASALNHPNICTLYESGEFDGRPYLAMEYIAGQPLNSAIPPEGFEPADVVKYGVQVAAALAHAHEHGVIHRDLKAANVVVTPQRRAKVLDFGIAQRLTAIGLGPGTGTLTETGTISGTLAYVAPERLRDQSADARSDIWALGVLLYEMASGRRPFTGDTQFGLSSAILKDLPPPLPAKVPAQLRDVILKCLEREPGNRFQRASDVVAALETHAHARRVGLESIWSARRTVVVMTVVGLLATAFALYLWRSRTAGRGSGVSSIMLAVLPFKVLSGAQDIGFLGIGIPDTIISRVALVRSIHVMGALVPGRRMKILRSQAGNSGSTTC